MKAEKEKSFIEAERELFPEDMQTMFYKNPFGDEKQLR